MQSISCWLISVLCLTACSGQSANKPKIGGAFENSAFTYAGMPRYIDATDTSAAWKEAGQRICITGTVYAADGKTPVPDVLLYYYQTNTSGKYIHRPEIPKSMTPNAAGQTHGYIRGWVKTDCYGKYAIYTIRPGVYPTMDAPAHIHMTVKEPNAIPEYYIDDIVFDDDVLVNTQYRRKMENRCGSGIVKLLDAGTYKVGERDVILGLHIPNHPQNRKQEIQSGMQPGETVFSFIPYHAWGPDKGTYTCPVCKYGWYHGILYCLSRQTDTTALREWLLLLEAESIKRQSYLKVYLVHGDSSYPIKERIALLENLGKKLGLRQVALTVVPSFADSASEVYLNNINPALNNTFILYKRGKVIGNFINLAPIKEHLALLQHTLDASVNEYFLH